MKFVKQNISDIISIIVLAIALLTTINSVKKKNFSLNFTDNLIAYFVIMIGTIYVGFISFSIYMRSHIIEDVSSLPANSLYGFIVPFIPGHKTSHRDMLKISEVYFNEGIVQFSAFGKHFVNVLDPAIAYKVLKTVHGKGWFHGGDSENKSMFNLDTCPEWQLRHSTFRKAYSENCIRNHEQDIKLKVNKMIAKLKNVAKKGIPVRMNEYFSQLSFDVICDVAFQFDVNSSDNNFLKYNDVQSAIHDIFELKHLHLFPGFKWLMKLPMFFNYLSNILPYNSFLKFKKAKETVKNFSRFVLQHIKDLNSNNNLRNEIATSLIEFSTLPQITTDDVLAEISTVLIGGVDTTTNTLNFLIYGLVVNQDVQSRCQSEINEWTFEKQSLYRNQEENEIILKDDIGLIEKNELKEMEFESQVSDFILPPYVESCIKESMRKWPVVNQSVRKVNEEQGFSIDILDKHVTIPQDSWLLVNFFALHNNSKIWTEEAYKFDPTRWLDLDTTTVSPSPRSAASLIEPSPNQYSSCPIKRRFSGDQDDLISLNKKKAMTTKAAYNGCSNKASKNDELAFAPFSTGPRSCIGKNLALLEIRTTVSELIKKFQFNIAETELIDERNSIETSFIMNIKKNFHVFITERNSSI